VAREEEEMKSVIQKPSVEKSDNNRPKPRYARWREKNPELYLERQRNYMRKKRAEAKEAGK